MRCAHLGTLMMVVASAGAQRPPAIRQLGRIERISGDSLASVAAALPMPGGRVLVNDITSRRLLMFDSTLAHPTVVSDTTSATANAYGSGFGATLIRYRGDTALFIDPSSLSMFVISPAGAIARVMAIPRPDDAQDLIGGIYGVPGFDARGRLVYFGGGNALANFLMLRVGSPLPSDARFLSRVKPNDRTDSTFIVAVDLATRAFDSVTSVKIPKRKREVKVDAQGLIQAIETTLDPLPRVDDWAVMPDGVIAVVRALDYHVDWIDADGHRSSSPKMPFEWQLVSDARKQLLIDSTVKRWQADFDSMLEPRNAGAGTGGRAAGGSGRGGGSSGRGGGSGTGGPGGGLAPTVALRATLSDLPDYIPPFTDNAIRPDADGNLWIRTTTIVSGQPVYDIVNRRGELVDRVQLPSFRTIAGFGPGVIYMAMKDAAGVVHLERSRIK